MIPLSVGASLLASHKFRSYTARQRILAMHTELMAPTPPLSRRPGVVKLPAQQSALPWHTHGTLTKCTKVSAVHEGEEDGERQRETRKR